MMKKRETLKTRGVRFEDDDWEFAQSEAAKDKSGRLKASDIIRHALKFYRENKDKFKK